MQKLEELFENWFVKKAPFQLPEDGKKGLVTALPWITLVGGVLELFAAWGLWAAATIVNNFVYGYGLYNSGMSTITPLLWVLLILVLAEALLFFVAFAPLRARAKKGWNILYWVSLINVAYALVSFISSYNLFSLLFSLAGSVVGLYLLFQIRSQYTSKK